MRYRILYSNGDMTFGSGLLNFYIDSTVGIVQLVGTTLELWLGEWYLNITDGVPYIESIIGKFSQAQADTAIQTAIFGIQVINDQGNTVPAINDISSYSSTLDPITRKMSVNMVLDTIYGTTPLEISNYAIF